MMFLLDVNVLLALGYPTHDHHGRVDMWLSQLEAQYGREHVVLATCPITELGFVRIGSGKAAYAPSVDAARSDLRTLKFRQNLLFIPDALHTGHLPAWVRESAQTTDGYLLALAASQGAHLATLDRFIPGAVLIPESPEGPLMVRDEPPHRERARLMRASTRAEYHWEATGRNVRSAASAEVRTPPPHCGTFTNFDAS
jgi:uncharacterized protein